MKFDHYAQAFASMPSPMKRSDAPREWAKLSDVQRNCLKALRFAVPKHRTLLFEEQRVRQSTLQALQRKGFVRHMPLTASGSILTMPFYVLTQDGQTLVRYHWQEQKRNASICIIHIPVLGE